MALRKICTIIHSEEGEEKGHELWANNHLRAYEEKYGKHFSDKLSEYASRMMKNRDNSSHYWSLTEVKSAFETLGLTLPRCATWGDAHYLANMAYADYITRDKSVFTEDIQAVKYAHLYLTDPDGKTTKAFTHYLADLMDCEECNVNWAEMI